MSKINPILAFLFLIVGFSFHGTAAVALEYPGEQWQQKSAQSLGLEQAKIDRLFDLSFVDSATQAVVLIKDGFLVSERYAEGYDQASYGTVVFCVHIVFAQQLQEVVGVSGDLLLCPSQALSDCNALPHILPDTVPYTVGTRSV